MLDLTPVEVALPYDQEFVREQWEPLETGKLALPAFRCDGSNMQRTVTDGFKEKCKEVMKEEGRTAEIIALWNKLRTPWSQTLQSFFHY